MLERVAGSMVKFSTRVHFDAILSESTQKFLSVPAVRYFPLQENCGITINEESEIFS